MGINNMNTGMTNIESLLKKNKLKYGEYWSPYQTGQFDNNLKNGELSDLPQPVRSQIVYSLQYLDFLKIILEDLKLHSIVETELYKTFIITAVSIIEAILYHIVKKNITNKWDKIEKNTLKSIAQIDEEKIIIRQKGVIDGEERNIKLSVINIIEPPILREDLKLRDLIDITKDIRCGLCNSHGYKTLHDLRNIRNKIHLTIDESAETDYNTINKAWYYTARESLYYILTSEKFEIINSDIYEFIKLSDDEEQEFEQIKDRRN